MLSKSEIANKLKQLRENSNLSVKEVIQKLSLNGIKISLKTLYAWESGRNQPDADTFMILCDIYKVENVMDTFGYKKSSTLAETRVEELSKDKQRLLESYYKLNEEGKAAALDSVESMTYNPKYKKCDSTQELA